MQKRNMDEMISYFNRKVADMDIELKYKMELLCMVTAFRIEYELQKQKTGKWIDLNATDRYKRVKVYDHFECPICHERSSNDSKYCPNCGSYLCGGCGRQVEQIDSYCAECGAKLDWSE